MISKKLILLTYFGVYAVLAGCAPVVLAGAGAGAVVLADKAAEDEDGGDGIF